MGWADEVNILYLRAINNCDQAINIILDGIWNMCVSGVSSLTNQKEHRHMKCLQCFQYIVCSEKKSQEKSQVKIFPKMNAAPFTSD